MSWDTRSTNTLGCLNTAGADVESMAVSGFHLMVAVGSSVNIYDLRFVAGSIDGRIALEYLNSSDTGYVFWCHPKSKDGRHQVVAVNDIAFNPFVSGAFVTGNNEGYVTSWDAQSKKRLLQGTCLKVVAAVQHLASTCKLLELQLANLQGFLEFEPTE
ncbi:hypothetical protein TEA_000771 [Camellia sinensis var. sinensis]|uniref:Uncharacterized protein n=1 Tax=Camellia sinensis var. sinensis TaxID=542762 RepID=A0A4S4E4B1_CAMSN|nr:hypothetical protein TEA_000771 [Camellia sinensis var. sinensis]